MSQQGTISRIFLIIEKIRKRQIPSIEAITNFLHTHGHEVSKRTVQRDLEQIINEYGIEIIYNREKKGYEIEESDEIDNFLHFLEVINTSELLTNSIKESRDALNFISFESSGAMKGTQYLKQLLFAIKNQREISFLHENYQTTEKKKYNFQPYYLKEFRNRWYIIGKIKLQSHFVSFGVDRIEDLIVSDTKQNLTDREEALEKFSDIVGLSNSDGKITEIILSFTPIQGKYIKSLPIHKSQTIIKDTDEELLIQYMLIPNIEFTQFLLMNGETVKVIKPFWLIDEIKQIYQNCLSQYK